MKISLFPFLLFIAFVSKSFCQTPNWNWANTINGHWDEKGEKIISDKNGNIFVVGSFKSPMINFGIDTLYCNSGGELFIVKYDSVGNPLWAKNIIDGIGGEAWVTGVSVDSVGDIYVCGYDSYQAVIIGTTTTWKWRVKDIFIKKYNTNGAEIWTKEFGGDVYDVANSITTSSDGSFFITGYFNSDSLIFGNDTLINPAHLSEFFIAKIDSTGTPLWAKKAQNITTWGFANGTSVTVDNFGCVYVSGEFGGSVNFDNTIVVSNNQSEDLFIAKYDNLGNNLWIKTFGSSNTDENFLIKCDNNNLYASGWHFYSASISFGNISLNLGPIFIAKFDLQGNTIWAKDIGSAYDDICTDIAVDVIGNFYISGYFETSLLNLGNFNLLNKDSNWGYSDVFIAKYDSNGNNIWSKSSDSTYIGTASELNRGICVDPFFNIYITGYFLNQIKFNSIFFNSSGNADFFTAKLTQNNMTTNTSFEQINNLSVSIFPNPSNSILNIKFEGDINNAYLTIVSSIGETIISSILKNNDSKLNIDELKPGVYCLKINYENKQWTSKIIIN